MFLKNSFSLFFLSFSFVTSFLNPFKTRTIEIEIPKLNYQESILIKNNNCLIIEEELNELKPNDKITIKKGNKKFYYKIITKYEKNIDEELPTLEKEKIALVEENHSTLQTIIIAINTGKLVKI